MILYLSKVIKELAKEYRMPEKIEWKLYRRIEGRQRKELQKKNGYGTKDD
ncbi:MAG TPA: hypothetical protein VHP81_08955 [Lachnospiraceae bacterium]|nr:hypothetical protein [Lachnospiraceae bacterium]